MITSAMVKELREVTGCGMMDCKNALSEAEGNMDKAIEMVADEMVEQIGGNYTQQLYEAMKRNYNIVEK